MLHTPYPQKNICIKAGKLLEHLYPDPVGGLLKTSLSPSHQIATRKTRSPFRPSSKLTMRDLEFAIWPAELFERKKMYESLRFN